MNDYEPEHRGENEEPVVGDAPPRANVLLSNAAYDKVKFFAQIVLPALGALYFGLAQLLGLPYGLEVVGVLALVDTFLGTVLGLSSKQYNNSDARFDGEVVVAEFDEETSSVNFKMDDTTPLANKDEVVFKVNRV